MYFILEDEVDFKKMLDNNFKIIIFLQNFENFNEFFEFIKQYFLNFARTLEFSNKFLKISKKILSFLNKFFKFRQIFRVFEQNF